jgi:hypothetical protein
VLAGPLFDQEGLVTAEIDLEAVTRALYDFDPVGHYSRSPSQHGFPAWNAVIYVGECMLVRFSLTKRFLSRLTGVQSKRLARANSFSSLRDE